MQRVIVQVPMSQSLKNMAEDVASDMGFSSLQEAIRVILTKLAKNQLSLRVEEVEEITDLSPRAERRFKRALADIRAGRNITKTKNPKELLSLLRS